MWGQSQPSLLCLQNQPWRRLLCLCSFYAEGWTTLNPSIYLFLNLKFDKQILFKNVFGSIYSANLTWKRGNFCWWQLVAEVLGTYFLIFAGCGAVVVNLGNDKVVTAPGVSIVWGLAVMVLVYSVGHISGAHFNPAVTIAFATCRRFPWKQVNYTGETFSRLGALQESALINVLFAVSKQPTFLSEKNLQTCFRRHVINTHIQMGM